MRLLAKGNSHADQRPIKTLCAVYLDPRESERKAQAKQESKKYGKVLRKKLLDFHFTSSIASKILKLKKSL